MSVQIGSTPEERAAQRAASAAVLAAEVSPGGLELTAVRIDAPEIGPDGVLRGTRLTADTLRIGADQSGAVAALLAWARSRIGGTSAP